MISEAPARWCVRSHLRATPCDSCKILRHGHLAHALHSFCSAQNTKGEGADMSHLFRRTSRLLGAAAITATLAFQGHALAQEDTIKIGILHSLSGTMAISETTLKDAMLILIDEQNKKGGVL